MSDVSPVDEQAAKAITDQESSELIGYRQTDEQKLAMVEFVAAKLAAARPVSAQARERTPWTGRALFERSEHEAERGRGWPWLSKVGKHSWDALAEQIEGEVLAAARPVPEDAGDERQPDAESRAVAARIAATAEIVCGACHGDRHSMAIACDEAREVARLIVETLEALTAAVPSVAQGPEPCPNCDEGVVWGTGMAAGALRGGEPVGEPVPIPVEEPCETCGGSGVPLAQAPTPEDERKHTITVAESPGPGSAFVARCDLCEWIGPMCPRPEVAAQFGRKHIESSFPIRAARASTGTEDARETPAEADLHNALLEINSDWSDWGEADALKRVLEIAEGALKGRPDYPLTARPVIGTEEER